MCSPLARLVVIVTLATVDAAIVIVLPESTVCMCLCLVSASVHTAGALFGVTIVPIAARSRLLLWLEREGRRGWGNLAVNQSLAIWASAAFCCGALAAGVFACAWLDSCATGSVRSYVNMQTTKR